MREKSEKTKKKLVMEEITKCPYCGADSKYFFTDSREGKIICTKCGTIISERIIDRGPEYRVFDSEDVGKVRAGPPISPRALDLGVNTIITATGAEYSAGKVRDTILYHRLKKMDSRTKMHNSQRRNFVKATRVLDKVTPILNLPGYVKNEAIKIYKYVLQNDLVKGRSVVPMIAGAVYIACRRHQIPHPLRQIAQAFNIKEKELGKSSRLLMKKVGIKVLPADPVSYVPQLCAKLGLPPKIQTLAMQIIEEAKKRNLAIGKDPKGTSAAAVYLACRLLKERQTQRKLAESAGVTEVTVRNRYKNMRKGLMDLINKYEKKNKTGET